MLTSKSRCSSKRVAVGKGLVNSIINKLPFEAHIPGYRFCGPGTKLKKRIERGDLPVNPLDEACKEHDLAYSKHSDISKRHEADQVLAEKALSRVKSKESSWGEKAAALGVAGSMKLKTKLGMGGRSKQNTLQAAKLALNSIKKKSSQRKKRVIPTPKTGGLLPLLPIFGALSALGALGGGAAAIAKTVNEVKSAKDQLQEAQRHNKMLEAISLGKAGKGLYLRPYKSGMGLKQRKKKKVNKKKNY